MGLHLCYWCKYLYFKLRKLVLLFKVFKMGVAELRGFVLLSKVL